MSDDKPDDKPPRAPLIESPVRFEAKVEANATEAINKLVDAGIDLGNVTVRPMGEALADLVVSMLDVVRGPFQRRRLQQLIQIAELTVKVRAAQGVVEPQPLAPEVQQLVLEKGSFVDDEKMRGLWAQLIVNAQAGVQIDVYLFELLSQLNGADVQLLDEMIASKWPLQRKGPSIAKLSALGLVDRTFHVEVPAAGDTVQRGHKPLKTELVWGGYEATSLGMMLHAAATGSVDPTAR